MLEMRIRQEHWIHATWRTYLATQSCADEHAAIRAALTPAGRLARRNSSKHWKRPCGANWLRRKVGARKRLEKIMIKSELDFE